VKDIWKMSYQQVEEFVEKNTTKDRETAELKLRLAARSEIETTYLLPVLMVQQ